MGSDMSRGFWILAPRALQMTPRITAGTRPARTAAALTAALLLSLAGEPLAQEPRERLDAARRYVSSQRLERAMREVDKVLAADPGSVEAWTLKADIFIRRADLDAALQALQQASRLAPQEVSLLAQIGDLLRRHSSRLGEALAVYGRALAIDPDNAALLVSVGTIHERREEWQQAAEAYGAALRIDPNEVRARSSLGAALFKLGRYDDASRELRKAIELSPRDLRSHVFLGMAQNHLGNYDVALERLKGALLIDPHAANQLIGVREQEQQFRTLIELFLRAFEETPREAGRSYDLAVVFFYAQDYQQAWRFLTRAEQLRFPIPIELKEVVYSRRRLRSPQDDPLLP